MRRRGTLLVGMIAIFWAGGPAGAQTVDELRGRVEEMQQKMETQTSRIRQLEAELAERAPERRSAGERRQIEDLVGRYLEEQRGLGGMMTESGDWFQIGGALEARFLDVQHDAYAGDGRNNDRRGGPTNEPDPHFAFDKLTLVPTARIGPSVSVRAELEFRTDSALLREGAGIFSFPNAPTEPWFAIGLDDAPYAPRIETDRFPLVGSAFFHEDSDQLGIFYRGRYRALGWALYLGNGRELNDVRAGEDESYGLVGDGRDEDYGALRRELAYDGAVWWTPDLGDYGSLTLEAFGALSRLDDNDIAFLRDEVTGYGLRGDDEKTRAGGWVEYEVGALRVLGLYVRARDGALERDGWFAQGSYRIELPEWAPAETLTPLLRYGVYRVQKLAPARSNSLTWDRDEWTGALHLGITRHVLLQIEYTREGEETGGGDIGNDQFLLHLEVRF